MRPAAGTYGIAAPRRMRRNPWERRGTGPRLPDRNGCTRRAATRGPPRGTHPRNHRTKAHPLHLPSRNAFPRGRGKAAQPADAAVIGERRGTGPRPTTNGYGCTRRDGTLPSARQAPGHALHRGASAAHKKTNRKREDRFRLERRRTGADTEPVAGGVAFGELRSGASVLRRKRAAAEAAARSRDAVSAQL